jgi:hypothetical protein
MKRKELAEHHQGEGPPVHLRAQGGSAPGCEPLRPDYDRRVIQAH